MAVPLAAQLTHHLSLRRRRPHRPPLLQRGTLTLGCVLLLRPWFLRVLLRRLWRFLLVVPLAAQLVVPLPFPLAVPLAAQLGVRGAWRSLLGLLLVVLLAAQLVQPG